MRLRSFHKNSFGAISPKRLEADLARMGDGMEGGTCQQGGKGEKPVNKAGEQRFHVDCRLQIDECTKENMQGLEMKLVRKDMRYAIEKIFLRYRISATHNLLQKRRQHMLTNRHSDKSIKRGL